MVVKSKKRHFVIQWGVGGVKKYTSKQHAMKYVCELLQHGEHSVNVFAIWDCEADRWSYDDRKVEQFIKKVTHKDRTEYINGNKADLFA
jgi:hypothetical protein